MSFEKTTEQPSKYRHLENMSVHSLLKHINDEDKTVPFAVEKSIGQIEKVCELVVDRLQKGGRLFYIGAGTSGRLGVVDASECPPTYGVSHNLVVGIISGGDTAIRKSVEHAEDSITQGWKDLQDHQINQKDIVIGIAASGTTPYVVSTLEKCNEHGIATACITNNRHSPLALVTKYPIEAVVGAEFVTGSSRMKAGTSQKLILNMISTTAMIQLGRVKDNKMVDMQLTNDKLKNRGVTMLVQELGIDEVAATKLLLKHKNVRQSIKEFRNSNS